MEPPRCRSRQASHRLTTARGLLCLLQRVAGFDRNESSEKRSGASGARDCSRQQWVGDHRAPDEWTQQMDDRCRAELASSSGRNLRRTRPERRAQDRYGRQWCDGSFSCTATTATERCTSDPSPQACSSRLQKLLSRSAETTAGNLGPHKTANGGNRVMPP